jgi:hypothetical protein
VTNTDDTAPRRAVVCLFGAFALDLGPNRYSLGGVASLPSVTAPDRVHQRPALYDLAVTVVGRPSGQVLDAQRHPAHSHLPVEIGGGDLWSRTPLGASPRHDFHAERTHELQTFVSGQTLPKLATDVM